MGRIQTSGGPRRHRPFPAASLIALGAALAVGALSGCDRVVDPGPAPSGTDEDARRAPVNPLAELAPTGPSPLAVTPPPVPWTGLAPRLAAFGGATPTERARLAGIFPEIRLRPESTGDAVLVAADAGPGAVVSPVLREVLRELGVIRRVGRRTADVWVDPNSLDEAGARLWGLARLDFPRVPRTTVGAVDTEGVALSGAPAFFDGEVTGAGVRVAVVDLTFHLWEPAVETGEILDPRGDDAPGGPIAHGTACAEIVQDMAPGAVLEPVRIATFADLEAFVDTLPGAGVDIVSDSLVWTEDSFSDGTGPHCALLRRARDAGVVWVTSAGNRGNGSFWTGTFTDADDDGRHEFAPGDQLDGLSLNDGEVIRVVLDWDAYPRTGIDLDLELYRVDPTDGPVAVATSADEQNGDQPPVEILGYRAEGTGEYGIAIARKGPVPEGLRVRLFPTVGVRLEHASRGRSLEDPAHCAEAVTVGAVPQGRYDDGPAWPSSAQGPTMDDRAKPDLVAPTSVRTASLGRFTGTSAAAPHVAGAIALYTELTGNPEVAARRLLEDAVPYPEPAPDVEGRGRMVVDPVRLDEPRCAPDGAETRDGEDDDCDEAVDEGLSCGDDGGVPDGGDATGGDDAGADGETDDGGAGDGLPGSGTPRLSGEGCGVGGTANPGATAWLLGALCLVARRIRGTSRPR